MSDWDLFTFLSFLQSDRFEPIEMVTFIDLAFNLLALLALGFLLLGLNGILLIQNLNVNPAQSWT